MTPPLISALFNPLNLLMLGVSVVSGLLAAWWMFPLGLLFWLVMVLRIARDPSLRLNQEVQSRTALPDRFQAPFTQIEKVQINLFNVINQTSPSVRKRLEPIRKLANQLTAEVYGLCQRMTPLENYRIVNDGKSNLDAEMNDLSYRIQTATDSIIRQELEESFAAMQQQSSRMKAVNEQMLRVDAQLLSLQSEMKTMLLDVTHLQALPSHLMQQEINRIAASLKKQIQDIRRVV